MTPGQLLDIAIEVVKQSGVDADARVRWNEGVCGPEATLTLRRFVGRDVSDIHFGIQIEALADMSIYDAVRQAQIMVDKIRPQPNKDVDR